MVFERVQEIIAEKLDLDPEEITMESSLDDDLEADSLDVIEIITALEDEFNITFQQEDLQEMEKVSDLISYIESK